jgi:hypothetical protein
MYAMHHHSNSTHFCYEEKHYAYLGSTRKADIELSKFNGTPLSEEGFLDLLMERYPSYYRSLQWVKFFYWTDSKRSWRLAVVNTAFDYKIRKEFYDSREEITLLSGWYLVAVRTS